MDPRNGFVLIVASTVWGGNTKTKSLGVSDYHTYTTVMSVFTIYLDYIRNILYFLYYSASKCVHFLDL